MSGPKQLSIILVLIFGIVACASTLDSNQPAERTYWLNPLIMPGATRAGGSSPSLVVTVTAVPGLDTDRMLILQSGSRLNFYQAARWPDNVPEVLESLLRRSLESTGAYTRVSGGHDERSADWQLRLEVSEFYTVSTSSDGAGEVRVVLNGYVNCHNADHAISLRADANPGSERLSLIVAAHEKALHKVSMDLVNQLLQACSPDE